MGHNEGAGTAFTARKRHIISVSARFSTGVLTPIPQRFVSYVIKSVGGQFACMALSTETSGLYFQHNTVLDALVDIYVYQLHRRVFVFVGDRVYALFLGERLLTSFPSLLQAIYARQNHAWQDQSRSVRSHCVPGDGSALIGPGLSLYVPLFFSISLSLSRYICMHIHFCLSRCLSPSLSALLVALSLSRFVALWSFPIPRPSLSPPRRERTLFFSLSVGCRA